MSRKSFFRFWERPDEPYTRPSLQLDRTESIDTLATAPNNPGPGRNVGRLYDALGVRLERVLKKATGRGHQIPEAILEFDQELDMSDSESIDTNATAPNNPGPGRNVGLLFDAVGKKIELVLNRTAGRLNLGPDAVAWQIRNLRHYRESFIVGRDRNKGAPPTYEELRVIKRLCRRLLKYCG